MKKYITLNTPLALFTEPAYASLSNDACLLYGLFLDREDYSRKNGWLENERVYFIFTIDEIMTFFKCSKGKAVKLKQELEAVGLLEQVKGGFNKPTKLFLSAIQTEQMYDVDSKTSPKTEPYLTKTNTKKQDTIKDTANELPQSQAIEILEKPVKASEVFNNGVNNLWFENKALNTMQRMANGSLEGVHKLISVALNAKKRVEKSVGQMLWLDYNDVETTVVIESINRLFKAGQIKNLEAYFYNSFRNMVENRLNTQMQHAIQEV